MERFFSISLPGGLIGGTISLLGKGILDYFTDKRKLKKIKQEKIKRLVQKVFFLLNDLDRNLHSLHSTYFNIHFFKDKNYKFLIKIDDKINIKIFRDLEYIFRFEIKSLEVVLEISKIENFWIHTLFLLQSFYIKHKNSPINEVNVRKLDEGNKNIDFEYILAHGMKDTSITFETYYAALRSYLSKFQQEMLTFLNNTMEKNSVQAFPGPKMEKLEKTQGVKNKQ